MWPCRGKSWQTHATIQVRRTRHAGLCCRIRDELISDITRWTLYHAWEKARRPARTYIQQLCVDTGCSLEDLLDAMDDGDGWRERVREIRADCATWWWWWWWYFLNCRREKERKYENWILHVCWRKRRTCHEEKEKADKELDFSFRIFW